MDSDPLIRLRAAGAAGDLDECLAAVRASQGAWPALPEDRQDEIRPEIQAAVIRLVEAGRAEAATEFVRHESVDRSELSRRLCAQTRDWPTETLLEWLRSVGPLQCGHEPCAFEEELVRRNDPLIPAFLRDRVEGLAGACRSEGESYAAHARRWSAFRYVRAVPKDAEIADLLDLVAKRDDPEAWADLTRWAVELPWGEDRAPTHRLAAILAAAPDPRRRAAIERALERTSVPGPARRWFLGALTTHDPPAAFRIGLTDLARPAEDEDRLEHLQTLGEIAEAARRQGRSLAAAGNALDGLSTVGWSRLARGMLAFLIRDFLPGVRAPAGCGWAERGIARAIFAFAAVRIDHLGCTVVLPLLFGALLLVFWGLDAWLGRPPSPWRGLRWLAGGAWVLTVGLTARTHFSGQETWHDGRRLAAVYWAATLAAASFAAWCTFADR